MIIEIETAELAQLVQEELVNAQFKNVDDFLINAIYALREKHANPRSLQRSPKNLAQFLLESPFAGSDLDLERQPDYGGPIDL